MNTIQTHITELISWGTTPNKAHNNRIHILKKTIVGLYHNFLTLPEIEEDDQEYPEPPDFNHEMISNTLRSNFPELGFYHSVTEPFNLESKEHSLEDANDDLTDVVQDMMEVNWRFEHTSKNDALWYFEFIMKNNSEQLIIHLLKAIKDLES